MTLIEFLVLAVAGFAAGVVNAVAGGGTFFTFSALVAGGLPTLDANATSAVALTPANIASVAAYRAEFRIYWREIIPFSIIGAIGGIIGAVLLFQLGDIGFRPLVPWLLLGATVLFALSGHLRRFVTPPDHDDFGSNRSKIMNVIDSNKLEHDVARTEDPRQRKPLRAFRHHAPVETRSPAARAAAYVLMALVSIYGGFFAAGMGIMMLAAMAIIEGGNFHKANTIKNVVSFFAQGAAIVLLIAGGLVHWPQALVTMVASIIGGYLGVGVARHVPEKMVRAVVVTIGAALTIIFFVRA